MRADELLRGNIGDLRRSDDGAVIHVRGKGGKDRRVPIEPAMFEMLERYLDSPTLIAGGGDLSGAQSRG